MKSEYELKAQKQADMAFDSAIARGVLSLDESADNYAGDYMFMGVSQDSAHKDVFKHRVTRQKIYTGGRQ